MRMASTIAGKGSYIFEALLFLFAASLFLTLGSDFRPHFLVRLIYGALLIAVFFALYRSKAVFRTPIDWPVLMFGFVTAFQFVRGLDGAMMLSIGDVQDPETTAFYHRYLWAALTWGLYFGLFIVSYGWMRSRASLHRFLYVLAWCGFFLAINAIPALLKHGRGMPGYLDESGEFSFFFPFLYFAEWVTQYVMTRSSHVNWIGDLMAIGFFAAVAVLFYAHEKLKEDLRQLRHGNYQVRWVPKAVLCGVYLVVALTIASGIIPLLARGTTGLLAICFTIYLLLHVVKRPSKNRIRNTAVLILVTMAFVYWSTNWQRAWNEFFGPGKNPVKIEQIFGPTQVEGSRRAIRIFKEYWPIGAGTKGYAAVSGYFATPGTESDVVAAFQALNHYTHTLAEEGLGALLYFAFLLSFLIAVIRGLIRTHSRFKYITANALFCLWLLLFVHAIIIDSLQRFPIACLVYILMGTILAAVSPHFENELN